MMDMRPDKLARLMASDDGVEQLMQQPVYENEFGYYSQAELLADVINILRMDAKRMGAMFGFDVEIKRMKPDTMAWMLAQMVDGNTQPLVEVFNQIEDHHHDIMEAELSEEEFRKYLEFKESKLFTVDMEGAQGSKRSPDEVAAEIEQEMDEVETTDLDIETDERPHEEESEA